LLSLNLKNKRRGIQNQTLWLKLMQKRGAKGIEFSNKSKGIIGKLLKMYLLTLPSGYILGYPEMEYTGETIWDGGSRKHIP
jgi:hypothetical protein